MKKKILVFVKYLGAQQTCRAKLISINQSQKILLVPKNNLSAAAHLIHDSSENRFRATYHPENLIQEEIQNVHFNFSRINKIVNKHNSEKLNDGFNVLPGGKEIFYISNLVSDYGLTKNNLRINRLNQ